MLHRRSFLATVGAALGAVSAWQPWPSAFAQEPRRARVTFVLFNDIYLMGDQEFPDGRRRGGFARLATIVKAERARGRHVIVAHGGDTLSPSLMSGLDRGAHIIALTNMIAPDVFVPGNHEFDFGKATFFERMAEAKFPLYGANLRDADGTPLPGFKDRTIIDIDGVRVGITGLAYDKSARSSSPEDLRFASTIDTTKSEVAALRADGADFTVAVMHVDRGDALALQFARAADLLLTGHTHDLYVNFDGVNAIVESSFDAHYVTAIDIELVLRERGDRRSLDWWPQFRVIDTATVEPDAEVAAVVAGYQARLDREMNVPIGVTAVELDSRNATVRTGEAAIGNLFADAMREGAHAEAALMNGGGIRANRVYAPGTAITRRDILTELPFNNRVVVLDVPGKALRQAVENGLRQLPYSGGRFPQVSGMEITYAVARPPGARIVAMRVAGAPLDEERSYRLAVVDFLARGGDDYAMLHKAPRIVPEHDAPLLATEVMAFIARLGKVTTTVEGRLRPL